MEPKAITNQRDLWQQVFPWPEDIPLPRPRFGKALPPPPVRLPEPLVQDGSGNARQPFRFSWRIEDLALAIAVREQQTTEGSEVWVNVESSHSDLLGKSVSVSLLGENTNRMKRLTVPLDTPTESGCRGQRRFGVLQELSEMLGNLVTVDAFLLE